jgi:hypothetical protein
VLERWIDQISTRVKDCNFYAFAFGTAPFIWNIWYCLIPVEKCHVNKGVLFKSTSLEK